MATFDLLQEYDLLKWDRLRMLARDASADSLTIAESALQAMRDEIDTRQCLLRQFPGGPHEPSLPDRSSRRYRDLQRTARDLKTLWPIERFVTIVVGVTLQPAGRSLKGKCPIPDHDDRTPSFHVYPDSDRWHCYGYCNRGGDIYDLTGLYFNLASFRDRVERVRAATPGLTGGAG